MQNNTHMEDPMKRLLRFQNGPPSEIIDTLTNSIANYFNNEICVTVERNNYQSSLLFLGIHSVALTISEGLFNKTGPDGYKLFLERFVDGTTPDTKFSTIAQEIHDWRNIIAHQWIGSMGNDIGYDYTMTEGWKKDDKITLINPKIYCDHYMKAFGPGGTIYNYATLLSAQGLEEAKQRLITKYLKN